MKTKSGIQSLSFEYKFSSKKSITVEFEISNSKGKRIAQNIKLISNWGAHYPKNPTIKRDSNGQYGFFENGVLVTNGDIQQIIKRIHQMQDDNIK